MLCTALGFQVHLKYFMTNLEKVKPRGEELEEDAQKVPTPRAPTVAQ